MISPRVLSWIENADASSRFGIFDQDQIPLVAIACGTTEPKISASGRSAQRPRLDVFKFQSDRLELLRHQAIAATIASVSFNLSSQLRPEASRHRLPFLFEPIESQARLRSPRHEFMHLDKKSVQFPFFRHTERATLVFSEEPVQTSLLLR